MTDPSPLDARDDLRELADRYETVAALDLTPDPSEQVRHAAPGSRVPPGAQEILDADEISRALAEVDDWAEFLAHVLLDEREVLDAGSTPGRLRAAGEHAAHFLGHADEMLALAFDDELHEHLRSLRRLSRRKVKHIRTHHRCVRSVCNGRLVSTVGEGADAALRCDECGDVVPYIVWSAWPKRVTYITPEHAAKRLGCTLAAVYIKASRGKWHKVGTGRDVRYLVADVDRAAEGDGTPDVRVDVEQVARVP